MPAVRKPASTETAVRVSGSTGWTQSFARTRRRPAAHPEMMGRGGPAVKQVISEPARQVIRLPRLELRPSRRLRRRLGLGLERPEHVASAGPCTHQLGIIAELILNDAIEQPHLLRDLRPDGFEIGACARMLAPA